MFDKPAHPDAVRLWPGSIPISHRYTAGLAGERFFRALVGRCGTTPLGREAKQLGALPVVPK